MPKFLLSSAFGLDVSDQSLKFAELIPVKNGIKLGRHGERPIPPGIIESGEIKDPKRLQEVLQALRKEEGIKFVRVSLPEEQVYLFRLKLEKEGLENIRESIELTLEEHIPIQAEDAIFDYDIISEDEKKLELQVAAIQKNIIDNYLTVFRESLISVQSFELEAQAIARALIKSGDIETYMIVDFGQTRTGIFIVSRGIVVFTSTLDVGGVMLSNMIKKNFNVTFEEAEKIKEEHGLERNAENREIFSVLLNIVSVMRDEIAKHFLYWHTHKDEDGKDRPPIRKIILSGGDANLIGLAEYLSVSMKTEAEKGNVWTNITDTEKNIPEISLNKSLAFACAFGLALGDFEI